MDLLSQRSGGNKNSILEQRFIQQVLQESAGEMNDDMLKVMLNKGFTDAALLGNRSFNVNNNILSYTHLKRHRFIDMSTRKTKNTVVKKVSHPIHNRILYGNANNIVRKLSFAFTEKTKQLLMF